MDINERCRSLPILRTQKVEWTEGKNIDNVITMPYPKYINEVDSWIKSFYSLDIADKDYVEHMQEIKNKQISELSRDETLSRITSVIRSERFCIGTLAEAIENGSLEELCVHLHEVSQE